MEKNIIEKLRKYLISCVEKEGIINGKRMFALHLGKIENDLFNNMDEDHSSVYNFSDYFEDDYLEELQLVDELEVPGNLNVVSL